MTVTVTTTSGFQVDDDLDNDFDDKNKPEKNFGTNCSLGHQDPASR